MSPAFLHHSRVRLVKALRLARRPRLWRPAVRGTVASLEHADVPFRHDYATVLDVGSSRGQFALFALERFPRAHLRCFEPLEASREALVGVLAAERTTVHPVAVGKNDGSAILHVSASDDSSSLLPIGRRQIAEFPGTEEQRTEEVSVRALDTLLDDIPRPSLLKIDVQGGELDVLKGASRCLGSIDTVFVEASFVELYESQALATDVIVALAEHGFALTGVYGVARGRHGECLQGDFMFDRTTDVADRGYGAAP
jgi:FkbM family methyltransferase